MRGLIVAFLAFFLTLVAVTPAQGAPLNAQERAALLDGKLVKRPLQTQRRGKNYLGGISYLLVDATPAEVQSALATPDALYHVLPRTRHVEVLHREKDKALVELVSGGSWITATFSAQLRWSVAPDRRSATVRFWLEDRRPADISDLFGYIRISRFGKHRTLVTVAAMLDLGGGLLGMLLEDRIQASLLRIPTLVNRYVARRSRERKSKPPDVPHKKTGQAPSREATQRTRPPRG